MWLRRAPSGASFIPRSAGGARERRHIKTMRRSFVLAASLALSWASPARAQLLPGWGLQQGRASQADMHQLRMDAGRLVIAERDFMVKQGDAAKLLGIERQKEMMGSDAGSRTSPPPSRRALEAFGNGG